MFINNAKKIDGIKPMLISYFMGKSKISKERLETRVDSDIIEISLKEGFIIRVDSNYMITAKGEKYMNK